MHSLMSLLYLLISLHLVIFFWRSFYSILLDFLRSCISISGLIARDSAEIVGEMLLENSRNSKSWSAHVENLDALVGFVPLTQPFSMRSYFLIPILWICFDCYFNEIVYINLLMMRSVIDLPRLGAEVALST